MRSLRLSLGSLGHVYAFDRPEIGYTITFLSKTVTIAVLEPANGGSRVRGGLSLRRGGC